jgi:hypothetical protein
VRVPGRVHYPDVDAEFLEVHIILDEYLGYSQRLTRILAK